MMLRRIKTSGILFFIFCVFTAEAQTTASEMWLKGNVSKVYAYRHRAKNIVIENDTLVSYEKEKLLHHVDYIFDKKGLLLAENRFDYQDVINLSYIYDYDESGRLMEITIAASGKILYGRTEYKYNENGKKIKELEYNDKDSLKTITVYEYDSLGNLAVEKTYNKLNRLTKNIYYQHDERGNIVFSNSVKINIVAKEPYQEVQKFNDKNKLIYKSYTSLDTLRWEYTALYGQNDSLIYEEVKDGTGTLLSYSKLTFDKKNRRISLKQYQKTALWFGWETYYQYDKKDRLVTETTYTGNKKLFLTERTYFYDERGNWIYYVEEDKMNNVYYVCYRKLVYY